MVWAVERVTVDRVRVRVLELSRSSVCLLSLGLVDRRLILPSTERGLIDDGGLICVLGLCRVCSRQPPIAASVVVVVVVVVVAFAATGVLLHPLAELKRVRGGAAARGGTLRHVGRLSPRLRGVAVLDDQLIDDRFVLRARLRDRAVLRRDRSIAPLDTPSVVVRPVLLDSATRARDNPVGALRHVLTVVRRDLEHACRRRAVPAAARTVRPGVVP
jgi:hypothetical protein